MKQKGWFDIDKRGWAQVLARQGKALIIYEPFQNAWDTDGTRLDASLKHSGTGRLYRLSVADNDPNGFSDISHAYTLFAASKKKGDPEKRGRFNQGEKVVLALCKEAQIATTTGTVHFQKDGSRISASGKKTDKGSVFSADIVLTKEEFNEICIAAKTLIPPLHCETYFNGERIKNRKPLVSFTGKLHTETMDEETGNLKPTQRNTTIHIYRPKTGEKATLYEMGIPVVQTGDAFHVDVQQKIPLNMDRDNVTPSYLRTIRTLVLNHTYKLINTDTANQTWVKEATSDKRVDEEAFKATLDLRFGKKRVSFDPSDTEANNLAMSKGHTVISGRSLSGSEWNNAKRFSAILPAGKVTPSNSSVTFSANGTPPISENKLTAGQKKMREFCVALAEKIMGVKISVSFYRSLPGCGACYGNRVLCFNVKKLGHRFFNTFPSNLETVIDLLLDEFGHEYADNHLSDQYYKALRRLGAKCTVLALKKPDFFNRYQD